MAIGFTCGPDAALAEYPCMNTLPDKAVIAAIAIITWYLALSGRATVDADTMAACDPCWLALNKHEKLVALANILLSWAVATGYISDANITQGQAGSCLLSLGEEELYAIILCNLCTMASNYTLV